ncbi:peptidase M48-like protein [Haloactinopolyspora alba]|uniref:Peptidase M48-like protein n=1 Tax=Haloactinopolyspora alba TaxID=648780 RepID=A0A2P8E587_9ACTN|nr:M56 family metallopeptidase [Haloactinopolyspora alba]PSL04636.1 peptidase M48-like protein [Haloactinopolyspora alba]
MTHSTPTVLLTLALLLAGPAPALLSRARWPSRVPRAALVLWQSLALSALLSALGAGASAGAMVVAYDHPSVVLVVLHASALLLTLVVLARLLWSAHVLGMTLRTRRRRQRHLVDLVARTDGRAPGVHVLDAGRPLAYCIPGLPSRLVVSSPALDDLADDEMTAVLEHERAHGRARHDLVLEGFGALHNAFPRFVRSRTALDSTSGLVEMLADDAARRRAGDVPLARALVRLADAPAPAGAMAAGAVTPAARIRRLTEYELTRRELTDAPVVTSLAYLTAAALVIVPTVAVAAPWLAAVAAAL